MCKEQVNRKKSISAGPLAQLVVIHRVAGIVPSIICANITAINVSSDFGAPTKIRKEHTASRSFLPLLVN